MCMCVVYVYVWSSVCMEWYMCMYGVAVFEIRKIFDSSKYKPWSPNACIN